MRSNILKPSVNVRSPLVGRLVRDVTQGPVRSPVGTVNLGMGRPHKGDDRSPESVRQMHGSSVSRQDEDRSMKERYETW